MAERVTFPSTTGPVLAGLVDLPEGEVRGWGVFAHGFTLGKDSPAASRICKQLAAEGIGMLRFDNLGLGDSEGDWGDGSFSHKVADTVRAVEFMNDSGREIHVLVGHSFGGSAVIAAAHDCPTVDAVASIGAPYDPGHVEHNYDALVARIEADGEAPFLAGGKALTLKRHFIEDVRNADLREQIRTLRRALHRHAFAHRQHRRHRQRQRDLSRRPPPPQLRVARGRRPPAHGQEPGRPRGPHHQRVGRPLPVIAVCRRAHYLVFG